MLYANFGEIPDFLEVVYGIARPGPVHFIVCEATVRVPDWLRAEHAAFARESNRSRPGLCRLTGNLPLRPRR